MYATRSKPTKVPMDPTMSDPFYRYQMDQLQVKSESNKTVLVNYDTVCQQMKIDPNLLIRYLSMKLGSRAKFDSKKKQWCIYSGTVTLDALSICLIQFLIAVVLCPICRLPELTYESGKKTTTIKCNSCPWTGSPKDLPIDEKIKKLI